MQFKSAAQRKAVWAHSSYGVGAPRTGPHWSTKAMPRGHALRGRGGRATRRRQVLGGLALGAGATSLVAAGAYGRFVPLLGAKTSETGSQYVLPWRLDPQNPYKMERQFFSVRPASEKEVEALSLMKRLGFQKLAARWGFKEIPMGRLGGEELIWHAPGIPSSTQRLSRFYRWLGDRASRATLHNIGGTGAGYQALETGLRSTGVELKRTVHKQLGGWMRRRGVLFTRAPFEKLNAAIASADRTLSRAAIRSVRSGLRNVGDDIAKNVIRGAFR